jgi:ABC-type spermidine/putrescine transport system permease subunit II
VSRLLSLYAAAVFAFLHLPLAVLSIFSFNHSRFTVWEGFSLRWYVTAFNDAHLAEATWNSLVIALSATVFPPRQVHFAHTLYGSGSPLWSQAGCTCRW